MGFCHFSILGPGGFLAFFWGQGSGGVWGLGYAKGGSESNEDMINCCELNTISQNARLSFGETLLLPVLFFCNLHSNNAI